MEDEACNLAQLLEIAAPAQTSADELQQWVSGWQDSYDAARGLSDEQRHYLKSGGWWPPVTAAQIESNAPEIVRRTRGPGLWCRAKFRTTGEATGMSDALDRPVSGEPKILEDLFSFVTYPAVRLGFLDARAGQPFELRNIPDRILLKRRREP